MARKKQYSLWKTPRKPNSGPSTYKCVVCSLPDSITITIDKKKGSSRVKCSSSSCDTKYEAALGHQREEFDIYSNWVDHEADVHEERIAAGKPVEAQAKADADIEAQAEAEDAGTEKAPLSGLQGPSEILWMPQLASSAHLSSPTFSSAQADGETATMAFRFMELPKAVRADVYALNIAHYHSTTLFTGPSDTGSDVALKTTLRTIAMKSVLPVRPRKNQKLATASPLIRVSKEMNVEYYEALDDVVSTGSVGLLLRARKWDFGPAVTYLASLSTDEIVKFRNRTTPMYLSVNAPGYNISPKGTGMTKHNAKQIYHNPDPQSMHSSFDELQHHLHRLKLSDVIQPVIETAAYRVRLSIPGGFNVALVTWAPSQVKGKFQVLLEAWTVHCKSLVADDAPDKDFQREPAHEFCKCRSATKALDIKCEHINPVSDEQEQIWAQNKLARDGAEE